MISWLQKTKGEAHERITPALLNSSRSTLGMTPMPDLSTKAKEQQYIGLDMAKVEEEKHAAAVERGRPLAGAPGGRMQRTALRTAADAERT
jgi:hypothetical protein